MTINYRNLPDEWKKVSSYTAILHILIVWVAIVGTIYTQHQLQNVYTYFLMMALIGGLQNNLNSMGHHGIHGNIHPNKRVNNSIARFFAAGPLGQLFNRLRCEHLAHHAQFGDDDDPERFYYDLRLHCRRSRFGFLRWCVCVFLGWVLYPMFRRYLYGARGPLTETEKKLEGGPREKILDLLTVIWAQSVVFAGLFLLTGSAWGYFYYWVFPIATFGAGFVAIRATIEHANADEPDHVLITFQSNPVERFFVGPMNFNYHYEHHRFMQIPYYNIQKVRDFLQNKDDYNDVVLAPSYVSRVFRVSKGLRK